MKYHPASRLALLKPSPIRLLSEGAPPDSIPLGLGEPTWDLPEPARKALSEVHGVCAYGPNMGLPGLRRVLSHWHGVTPEEIMVTVGSEEALMVLFLAYLDPGDVVLLPDPGYPAYAALARLSGAEPKTYALNVADRFRLDATSFIAALDATPGVKVALINGPSNPTGASPTSATLLQIADACEARGVLLISDEVYRDLHFGVRPPSLRDVCDTGIVVSSVSKAWGSPGLRIGWMVGDPALIAPARTVHGFAVTCATAPAQQAAIALLEASDVILPAARNEVLSRWEALAESMKAEIGLEILPPDGGFYHWMPLPAWAKADPMAACLRLRDEARVVLVPGTTFGEVGRTHARLSFAAFPEQIREGVRRIAPYWK
jgi:aspartate/methionine/tyrosine aminotransferase